MTLYHVINIIFFYTIEIFYYIYMLTLNLIITMLLIKSLCIKFEQRNKIQLGFIRVEET